MSSSPALMQKFLFVTLPFTQSQLVSVEPVMREVQVGETRALAYTSVISLLDSNGYMSGFDRMNSLVVEVGARDLVSFHSWLEEDDKRFVISFEIAVPPFAQSHPRQLVIMRQPDQ